MSLLAATYLKSSNALLAVGGPIFVGLALLARPAVRLALGPGWEETAYILQWIALTAAISLPTYHIGGLALSLDQVRMVAWRTFGEFVVAMPALFIGSVYYGIPGVIAARIFARIVVAVISMEAVRRLIHCSMLEQLACLRRTLFALLALAAALFALRPLIIMGSVPQLVTTLVAVSILGGIVYLAALYAFWVLEGRPGGIERVVYEKLAAFFRKLQSSH